MTPGLLSRVQFSRTRLPNRLAVRSRVRSARGAVLFGFLLILAATVGMTSAVETVKPEWRDPEFGHRLARLQQARRESPDRPLVLMLGSSRAQNAFHPAAMGFLDVPGSPRAFNFGQSAATALKVLLTFARVLDEGIRPSAIVIEVMPAWLVADGPAEEQFRQHIPRLSAADLPHLAPYSASPESLRAQWLAARAAPLYTQRLVLMSHWLPRWLAWNARADGQWETMDPDGFIAFPHSDPPAEFRAKATAHAHREYSGAFNGFRAGEVSVRALRDIVARCRAEGIPVALALPPVSPTFRGWFRPAVWTNGDAFVLDLARSMDVEVFPAPSFSDADFADGHHLLPGGADRYSRWLADTHLKPWLARQGVTR